MTHYVYGSLSYLDYLQQKSFVDEIKGEISNSSKALIATNSELARRQIHSIEGVSSEVNKGFDRIAMSLQATNDGLQELGQMFHWGFSEMLIKMGHVSDSLKKLIEIASTPSKTWAYEQFNIAREAFGKGLYQESLNYVVRAIDGYQGQTGYLLEYRFHFLLGILRLGSFENTDPKICDPKKAKEAFANAAKYSIQENILEAARAYLAAGWASYCSGEVKDAEALTEKAIECDANLIEAYYQTAKIRMHLNKPDDAIYLLEKAIRTDRLYAVKASIDADFITNINYVNKLIEKLRDEKKDLVELGLSELENEFNRLNSFRFGSYSVSKSQKTEKYSKAFLAAKNSAKHETYFGYLDAFEYCIEAKNELIKLYNDFFKSTISDATKKSNSINNEIKSTYDDQLKIPKKEGKIAVASLAISIILGIISYARVFSTHHSFLTDAYLYTNDKMMKYALVQLFLFSFVGLIIFVFTKTHYKKLYEQKQVSLTKMNKTKNDLIVSKCQPKFSFTEQESDRE